MSASGNWVLTINTPMGKQSWTLSLVQDGAALTGKVSGSPDGDIDLKEGKADGANLSWKVDMKKPMPMTLTFEIAVNNDTMAGNARFNPFPPLAVSGVRV